MKQQYRFRRVAGAFLGVAMVVSALVACSGTSNTTTQDKALRVVMATAPTSLDPIDQFGGTDTLSGNMYVTLLRTGTKDLGNGLSTENGADVEGYLAKDWKVSDDGLTYTFHLKPGLTFASGTPVDSAAVKYSFERALDSTAEAFITTLTPGLIKSIDTPDADTVVFTLSEPRPSVLQAWASYSSAIVDPSVVKAKGAKWLDTNEAGSGPYELVSYTPNRELVMKERPGFAKWAGWAPKRQNVTVQFAADDSALLLAVKQGADVVIGLTSQSVASLKNDSAVRVETFESVRTRFLNLAWSKAPFSNAKVREALTYAVDLKAILDGPANGDGQLYYGPSNPNLPFFNKELATPITRDVAKAEQLLKDSGETLPIRFTLSIDQGAPVDKQIAQVLQSTLKPAGFDIQIEVLPTAEFSEATYADGFQAQIREDAPGYADTGFYLGYAMACVLKPVGTNASHMCMPEADKLLAAARATTDPEKAQAKYDEITRIWRENYPQIPLFAMSPAIVLSKSVTSFEYSYDFSNRVTDWG
ncbi:ABC transporter substrate-binding protein [Microbacterium sp. KR10-403]|uniref:ABC transporter substrate-binding protein n=1 Tax=Microbacterium sp. KR10-403 TaxID=3158581 RepID=UPI0032E4A10A